MTHKVITTTADRLRVARASTAEDARDRGALNAHEAVAGEGGEIEKAHKTLDIVVTVLMES